MEYMSNVFRIHLLTNIPYINVIHYIYFKNNSSIEFYSSGTCKFILKPTDIGAPNLQIRPKGGMYFQPGLK
jgi:hypothetical protein